MAIAIQNTYTYASVSGGEVDPVLSVTVSAASDLAIILFTAHTNSASSTQGTFARNGQSFASLGTVSSGDFSTLKAWFLRNPSTGTHNITSSTGGIRQGFVAHVLTGVSQSADPTTITTSNAQSLDITAIAGSRVFDGWVERNSDSAVYTQGAGQTLLTSLTFADGGGGGEGTLNTSVENGTAGTVTMSWTSAGGAPEEGSHIAVVVNEASASGNANLLGGKLAGLLRGKL